MNVMEWVTEEGCAYGATITLGAVTTSCAVVIQLKDYAGNDLAVKGMVGLYLSSDADGETKDNIDNIAAGTDGNVWELLADNYYMACSEADGDIDLTLTEAADTDVYLNVVLPNGKIVTSAIMEFTG